MQFPEEKDIQRIIGMAGMDEGFFSIAVYSFIERYMKDFINQKGKYSIGEFDDKFKDISVKFWSSLYNKQIEDRYNKYGLPYIWPVQKDSNFDLLLEICNGKGNADKVRHRFNYPELDQLQVSITHLKRFAHMAGETEAEKAFSELDSHFENWNNRQNSQELQQKVDELNGRILKFIESNGSKVKTIKELQEAQAEYQQRIAELEKIASVKSSSDQEIEELRRQNDLLLEYIENLKQLTSYTRTRGEYESSITRLSLDQMQAVQAYNGQENYLITGTAGTGKSLVLIKIIEKFIKESSEKGTDVPSYAFVTYTKSLVKYNRYMASLIEESIEQNIHTVNEILFQEFHKEFPRLYMETPDSNQDDTSTVKTFLAENFRKLDTFTRIAVAKELQQNIWPNLLDKDAFFSDDCALVSQGVSKQGIWDVAEACRKLTMNAVQNNRSLHIPQELAFYILAYSLEESSCRQYSYIFVDEAQDLSESRLRCLKNMSEKFIIASDRNQAIYRHNMNETRTENEFTGNTYHLATNFRNTIQINNFAERYRTGNFDSTSSLEEGILPSGFRNGPEVEVYCFDTPYMNYTSENIQSIKDKVDLYVEELGYSPDNICILISQNVATFGKELEQAGLQVDILKEMDDFAPTGKVKLSSIHSAKGLSFPVVLFVSGKDGVINECTAEEEKRSRNLYYIALSRAMDILNVFVLGSQRAIPYINDLTKIKTGK